MSNPTDQEDFPLPDYPYALPPSVLAALTLAVGILQEVDAANLNLSEGLRQRVHEAVAAVYGVMSGDAQDVATVEVEPDTNTSAQWQTFNVPPTTWVCDWCSRSHVCPMNRNVCTKRDCPSDYECPDCAAVEKAFQEAGKVAPAPVADDAVPVLRLTMANVIRSGE